MKTGRIVQVSSYYPPHLGGQENVVYDLAQQLASAGRTVHVLTSTQGGGKKGVMAEQNVTVSRMPGFVFGHAPIMPAFPWALFHAAQPGSIVHLHIGQAFTPEMVWLTAKLRGFKYIAELHIDFEPSGPAGILLPLYKNLVLKHVLQSAAAVITLNEKTLDTVRSTYGYEGRARVMSNGIDEAYFQLKRPPFTVRPPRTLRLLFVGRLSKQKNVTTLLKALKTTKRNVRLDIVGEGAQLELIKKTIADFGLENVVLHGRLDRRKVMKFYELYDALIMPSLYEAQPLVLLEAMAARIPIIGTNVIGVKDHIKDVGIVVEPTTSGLTDGIEQYYKKYHALSAMTGQGYEFAKKLRWPHMVKEYEKLYEEVLEN